MGWSKGLAGALKLAYVALDRAAVIGIRVARHEQRVLVVRVDAIGDFVLWLGAARALRELHAGKRIYLVANQAWSDWAEGLEVADELIPLDRRKFVENALYRWKFLRKVRRLGCEVAIQPTFFRELSIGDSVIRCSGARERIGSSGDFAGYRSWHRHVGDRWYTKLVAATEGPLMELRRNAEFMRGLGAKDFLAVIPSLGRVSRSQIGQVKDQPYFIVFPGASWRGKMWPVERFAEIAKRIQTCMGWHCLVCGGKEDHLPGEQVVSIAGSGVKNLAGCTTLDDLTELIAGAELVVANDTGAVHIAAATQTPAVCVMGGGHIDRFMPYDLEIKTSQQITPVPVVFKMDCFGCNWNCQFGVPAGGSVRCIEGVSVEAVWNEVQSQLDRVVGARVD